MAKPEKNREIVNDGKKCQSLRQEDELLSKENHRKKTKKREKTNKGFEMVERNLNKGRKKLENPLAATGKIW